MPSVQAADLAEQLAAQQTREAPHAAGSAASQAAAAGGDRTAALEARQVRRRLLLPAGPMRADTAAHLRAVL